MGKRFMYMDEDMTGAPGLLSGLDDVNINNPEDGQMLVYDASTQRWRNVTQKSLNDLAEVTDLTNIIATGTTNTTGVTIPKGTFFYLNDDLCQAKADIANGATFTLNTNYEEVTAGGLNALNSKIAQTDYVSVTADGIKTYKQLLNSLYTLIDRTKLTYQSVYVEDFGNNTYQIIPVNAVNPTNITCVWTNVSTKNQIRRYIIEASDSIRQTATGGDNAIDNSSLVPTSGTKLEFHY